MIAKPKFRNKTCQKHGWTEFVLEGSGYYRCKKCRVYYVDRRRKELKKKLVEHFGGECMKCGYDRCLAALDFHHLDPQTKKFGIGYKGYTRSFKSALEEAKKCVLICANCHREVENGG
jgi:hypothetical protein